MRLAKTLNIRNLKHNIMIIKKTKLTIILLVLLKSFLCGQNMVQNLPVPGKQVSMKEGIIGDVIDNYWIYLPRVHHSGRKWPVILFLQGGLGISADSTTSKNDGPAKYTSIENDHMELDSYVKDSFIIINPHMRPGSYWERQWYQQYNAMNSILDYVIKHHSGDATRIYVTGLSRGGNGTWGIGQLLNYRIAAIVPVCGITHGITDYSCFKDLPVWITHCTGDKTHDYQESVDAVNNIEEIARVKFLRLNTASPDKDDYLNHDYIFTTFIKESHDAWSETYDKAEIYKWLLKHKKE